MDSLQKNKGCNKNPWNIIWFSIIKNKSTEHAAHEESKETWTLLVHPKSPN